MGEKELSNDVSIGNTKDTKLSISFLRVLMSFVGLVLVLLVSLHYDSLTMALVGNPVVFLFFITGYKKPSSGNFKVSVAKWITRNYLE